MSPKECYFSEFAALLRDQIVINASLRAIFDSNVLISLLVFDDPRYPRIAAAWRAGSLCVLTDGGCAAEFRRVLGYPQFALTAERQAAIFAEFERRACDIAPDLAQVATGRTALPVCADADDQQFLELAARSAADCLVTGDRELRKLARRLPFAVVTADEFERQLADQGLSHV